MGPLNAQPDTFVFAGLPKVLGGLVPNSTNADGNIKFIKQLQSIQLLPRAGKVMSRKLNLTNETQILNEIREKRKPS